MSSWDNKERPPVPEARERWQLAWWARRRMRSWSQAGLLALKGWSLSIKMERRLLFESSKAGRWNWDTRVNVGPWKGWIIIEIIHWKKISLVAQGDKKICLGISWKWRKKSSLRIWDYSPASCKSGTEIYPSSMVQEP